MEENIIKCRLRFENDTNLRLQAVKKADDNYVLSILIENINEGLSRDIVKKSMAELSICLIRLLENLRQQKDFIGMDLDELGGTPLKTPGAPLPSPFVEKTDNGGKKEAELVKKYGKRNIEKLKREIKKKNEKTNNGRKKTG